MFVLIIRIAVYAVILTGSAALSIGAVYMFIKTLKEERNS